MWVWVPVCGFGVRCVCASFGVRASFFLPLCPSLSLHISFLSLSTSLFTHSPPPFFSFRVLPPFFHSLASIYPLLPPSFPPFVFSPKPPWSNHSLSFFTSIPHQPDRVCVDAPFSLHIYASRSLLSSNTHSLCQRRYTDVKLPGHHTDATGA